MTKLALALVVAVASSGCLGMVVPEHKEEAAAVDMAQPSGNGGNGGNNGGGGSMASQTGGDGGAPIGTLAFGATCTTDGPMGDCMSGLCKQFNGGAVHRCTSPCTYVSQTQPAPECPAPSAQLCTTNGYCKFTQ
jgi:hypothetical protein